MKKIYYFFTEGMPVRNISFGHFFRSYETAKYLKKKGLKSVFIIENPKYVKKFLKIENFEIINSRQFKKKEINKNKSILIFDKFSLTNSEIRLFQDYNKIVYDDFNKYNKHKNCLKITTNLSKKKYINNVFNSHNFRLIKFLNIKEERYNIEKKNFLVFLGGSDIRNNIPKLIKLILNEKINDQFHFSFYLGPGVNKKIINNSKNILFYRNNEKLLDRLIKINENIITNGGNTMFEMLMMKKKCLVFPSNKTEQKNSMFFEKNKIILTYKKKIKLKDQILSLEKFKINPIYKKYFNKILLKKDFEKAFSCY